MRRGGGRTVVCTLPGALPPPAICFQPPATPSRETKEGVTHLVGECEKVVLEEMRQIDELDVEKFSALDNSEKTIAYPRR